MIIHRLINAINEKQSPIVIGLDTTVDMIPDYIKQWAINKFGNVVTATVNSIYAFNTKILLAIKDYVSIIKINPACYELYGYQGYKILNQLVEFARDLGLFVIIDSKKNDVNHTAELYAQAAFSGEVPLIINGDKSPLPLRQYKPDFITINPYLGSDGINPFVEEANKNDKGIFILCRTSNISSHEYQGGAFHNDSVSHKVANVISGFGQQLPKDTYSSIGAVIGGTIYSPEMSILRSIMKNNYFLVPGYGNQNASMTTIAESFNNDGYGALIHASRSILMAHKLEKYKNEFAKEELYVQATMRAVQDMRTNVLSLLNDANKLPSNW
jgi:orotidine-5'-phosphate decarboxylase